MRDALSEADQFTIGAADDDAEPIVRALGEGLAPLPFANDAGRAVTAVCLDESDHVELGQSRHVSCSGSAKLKVPGAHSCLLGHPDHTHCMLDRGGDGSSFRCQKNYIPFKPDAAF